MAHVHAGQADHSVLFWLYNLPSNLFMLHEGQTITVVLLDQNLGLKCFLHLSSGAWTWGLAQQAAGISPSAPFITSDINIPYCFKKKTKQKYPTKIPQNTLENSGKHLMSIWRD